MRHYFPGVRLEELSDEEFAVLANDAEWFDAHQLMFQQAKSLQFLG